VRIQFIGSECKWYKWKKAKILDFVITVGVGYGLTKLLAFPEEQVLQARLGDRHHGQHGRLEAPVEFGKEQLLLSENLEQENNRIQQLGPMLVEESLAIRVTYARGL